MDNRPIGVFDSGLGGLTAVRELIRVMPGEDIVYFGDTGRVPYGTRSRETIIKYAMQDIAFISSFDTKAIVIACGTVSSVAHDVIAGKYDIPIVGTVKSSADKASKASISGRIGVIGTTGTVCSGAFGNMIRSLRPDADVIEKACPLLVPLVE
ncbi:MAG: glutamate racemase, partial [Clostridiales bacterium]|nr:glutamate racemase [Clostridiales bacterium]